MPTTINQRDLFMAPAPTSSAPSANGSTITLQQQVLREIRAAGVRGLTDEQLCLAFEQKGERHKESTTRARRRELVDAGLVVKTRSRRRTVAGVTAAVWVAAEFAQATATPAGASAGACRHEPHERTTFDNYIRTECRLCGDVLLPDRRSE